MEPAALDCFQEPSLSLNMNIYLVGFMGTGKSAVGRALSRKKGWCFVDLDELIEAKEKNSIAEIFAIEGEPSFRLKEQEMLKSVAVQNEMVVACGGGVVINPENIRLMKDSGKLICLSATPEVILKRTQGKTHRPLLNVENPREQIDLLLKKRAVYYSQADWTIDTSILSVNEVVENILKI